MKHIEVNITTQRVRVVENDHVVWEASVSTSKFGCGEEIGSNCTPRGIFRITEKIGSDVPVGAIFRNRKWTGEVWNSEEAADAEDLILTRILWLTGEEPANANTLDRHIYFHGTNREDLIGTPCSMGCIRLRNDDMLRLFEMVSVGTNVRVHM